LYENQKKNIFFSDFRTKSENQKNQKKIREFGKNFVECCCIGLSNVTSS